MQLLVVLFTGTVVTFGYTNWWDEDGPSANPHFTGDTSVTDIYEWTTEPNPQIRRARTEAASFSAVAATRIGTKGKGIVGLTVETGSTLTKPDGTNESYSRREISGTTGPPVLYYEDLDDISYTYYSCSDSKSISTSNVGDTYTVQVTGYGTGERWTGGFNIELGIANASLKASYTDGTKVSFPMSSLSGSASRTIIKDSQMPSGATCERAGCTVFLPRADYHKVNCPERIKVWYGTKACPGSWYTCESDASCDRVNDHAVECLGPTCFDEIKNSQNCVNPVS